MRKRPGPGLSLVRPVHLGWLWARFRVTEAGVEAGLRAWQEREVLSPGGDLLPPPPPARAFFGDAKMFICFGGCSKNERNRELQSA